LLIKSRGGNKTRRITRKTKEEKQKIRKPRLDMFRDADDRQLLRRHWQ
jgi:uncharacterized protein YnzC (UPF0291/DUF896 family)